MKFFSFAFLFLSLNLSANTDLSLLEEIVHSELSVEIKNSKKILLPDSPGSYSVSKNISLHEILQSIERCRNHESLKTLVSEEEDFRHISFSCKINKEIVVTETLVNVDNKIESFQEMTFEEKFIYPKDYLKLLGTYDSELTEISDTSTNGLKSLRTFARLGIPIVLAFKTSKILAPSRSDWQKHFIAGTLAGGITILTTHGILRFIAKKKNFHISERKLTYISSMAGLLISLLAGGGKEIYNTTGRGTPEWQDAMFTAAGGAMISLFYAIPFGRWFGWGKDAMPVPMNVSGPS